MTKAKARDADHPAAGCRRPGSLFGPKRSVSLPANGIVIIAPIPCGASSSPDSSAEAPRTVWSVERDQQQRAKKAIAKSRKAPAAAPARVWVKVRVRQVADAAVIAGRKVVFLGRSMVNNVTLGREMGMLDVPVSSVIDIDDVPKYTPGEVCIICTGSQGEPMSALSSMAAHEHKHVKISSDDVVVISAHAIPGNEINVTRIIDSLHRAGAEVLHGGSSPVHVFGHTSQEELKMLINITQPEWFVPVHGEYTHMVHHARLAEQVGVPKDHVLIVEDGDMLTLVLQDDGTTEIDIERRAVPSGFLYVDGIVGDVGQGVLRDRRNLAEEGLVVVIVTVDSKTGEVVTGPEIVTRGWVYAPEAEDLLEDAKAAVLASLREATDEGAIDFDTLRRHARRSLGKFINERTKRRPAVIPVVMEV